VASEPAETDFKTEVKATAYPVVERNGVGWIYMGPLASPPPLPELEWNMVPEDQVYVTLRVADSTGCKRSKAKLTRRNSGFPAHASWTRKKTYTNSRRTSARARRPVLGVLGMYYKIKISIPVFEVLGYRLRCLDRRTTATPGARQLLLAQ